MPRSSRTGELQYNPEIEKTARRLRNEAKLHKQVPLSSSPRLNLTVDLVDSSKDSKTE